jgi:hypothetical protein
VWHKHVFEADGTVRSVERRLTSIPRADEHRFDEERVTLIDWISDLP